MAQALEEPFLRGEQHTDMTKLLENIEEWEKILNDIKNDVEPLKDIKDRMEDIVKKPLKYIEDEDREELIKFTKHRLELLKDRREIQIDIEEWEKILKDVKDGVGPLEDIEKREKLIEFLEGRVNFIKKIKDNFGQKEINYVNSFIFLPSEINMSDADIRKYHISEKPVLRYIDALRLYGHIPRYQTSIDPAIEQDLFDYMDDFYIFSYMYQGEDTDDNDMTQPFLKERNVNLDSRIPEHAKGKIYERIIIINADNSSGYIPPKRVYRIYFPQTAEILRDGIVRPTAETLQDGVVRIETYPDGSTGYGEEGDELLNKKNSKIAIYSAIKFCDYTKLRLASNDDDDDEDITRIPCYPPMGDDLQLASSLRSIINEVINPQNRIDELEVLKKSKKRKKKPSTDRSGGSSDHKVKYQEFKNKYIRLKKKI